MSRMYCNLCSVTCVPRCTLEEEKHKQVHDSMTCDAYGPYSCMVHSCMVHSCMVHSCMVHSCMVHSCMVHSCMVFNAHQRHLRIPLMASACVRACLAKAAALLNALSARASTPLRSRPITRRARRAVITACIHTDSAADICLVRERGFVCLCRRPSQVRRMCTVNMYHAFYLCILIDVYTKIAMILKISWFQSV
jgi:hypothetical protein